MIFRYSESCATRTIIDTRFSWSLKETPYLLAVTLTFSQHLQLLVATDLLSVSTDLSFLDISHKWNVRGFLCALLSFTFISSRFILVVTCPNSIWRHHIQKIHSSVARWFKGSDVLLTERGDWIYPGGGAKGGTREPRCCLVSLREGKPRGAGIWKPTVKSSKGQILSSP